VVELLHVRGTVRIQSLERGENHATRLKAIRPGRQDCSDVVRWHVDKAVPSHDSAERRGCDAEEERVIQYQQKIWKVAARALEHSG
jgi:hypothetical protein